jgi:hypothetical protein
MELVISSVEGLASGPCVVVVKEAFYACFTRSIFQAAVRPRRQKQ